MYRHLNDNVHMRIMDVQFIFIQQNHLSEHINIHR